MKKTTFVLSLALLFSLVFTNTNLKSEEYPQKVLIEAFTSADCGPCAQYFPSVDKYLMDNDEMFIPIKYHIRIGGDPMALLNTAMSHGRGAYYMGDRLIAPAVRFMGLDFPREGFISLADQIKTAEPKSPYLVTVSQTLTPNKLTAHINVKASKEISNKALRVVLMEYEIKHTGTNGEPVHHWVARDMIPDIQGQFITINANGEENYNFDFNLKQDYNKNQLYVVAFIQDDSDKQVLQAGTNLNDIAAKAVITAVDQNTHILIDRNTTVNKVFNIENKSNKEYKFSMGLVLEGTYVDPESGISFEFDKTDVTLPAGGNENITLSITTKNQAIFTQLNLIPLLSDANSAINKSRSVIFRALTKDVKHIIYYSPLRAIQTLKTSRDVTKAFLNTYNDIKNDLVDIPITDLDLFTHFDILKLKELKTAAFLFDYWTTAALTQFPNITQQITKFLNADGRVLLADEYGLSNAFVPDVPFAQNLRTFITNQLRIRDIKVYPRVTLNEDGNITGFNTYKILGNSNDIIGKSIDVVNANTDPSNYHSIFNMNFNINTTIDDYTKPVFSYEDSKVAAIRKEFDKGKIVVLGFGINSLAEENQRNTILNNVYNWLMDDTSEEAKLAVHLEKDLIQFEDTKIGETSSSNFTISNVGKKPLTIETIELDDKDNFEITLPALPIVLNTGDNLDIPVQFSPKQSTDYYASIEFKSNSYMKEYIYVSLSGKGLGDVVEPNISIATKTIDFGILKPHETKTQKVKIKNTGNKTLKISNILVKNDNTGSFEVEEMNLIPIYIQENDEDEINITYMPVEEGKHSAKIEIYSDDPDSPQIDININGEAKADNSVASLDGNFTLKTLPNPMSSEGFALISALNQAIDIDIKIIDASGKLIQNVYSNSNFFGTNKIKLDISKLSNGYYILSANVDGKAFSTPLIIKK